MGLFQKQEIRKELVLPYTLATSETKRLLVVGLGNPGKKYDGTRHNIGFSVLDEVAKNGNFPEFAIHKDFNAEITEQSIGVTKIMLAKPTTYMNESGTSVQKIAQFYKIPLENIVVVHDELSIAFGQIRMRVSGQSAGHNGIKSIIQHCGQEFGRIRVGIRNEYTPKDDTSDFVLGSFTSEEKKHLPALVNEASLVVNEYMYSGVLPHDTRSILLI